MAMLDWEGHPSIIRNDGAKPWAGAQSKFLKRHIRLGPFMRLPTTRTDDGTFSWQDVYSATGIGRNVCCCPGTVVGDRIEGNAIADAFGGCGREVPLRLSSVKSNLGHMEAAAFYCALLKTILMMQEWTFVPISKNFNVPNLEIDFERGNMGQHASADGLRTVFGAARRGRNQLLWLRRGQWTLRGERVPASGTACLVGGSGFQ